MDDLFKIVKEPSELAPIPPPGLVFQLSVLTWIACEGESADPWALMRLAVPRLAMLVQADQVAAEYWIRERRGLFRRWHEERDRVQNWADLMRHSNDELAEKEEFPYLVTFERAGARVLLERTEFWNRVGGPSPYHDSVELSFLAAFDIRERIEDIILDTCRALGIKHITVE